MILAVSHRLRVLERADHVVLALGGCVVVQGDLGALLVSSEDVKGLWLAGEG